MKNDYSIFGPRNSRIHKINRVLYYFLYAIFVVMGLLVIFGCFNRIYFAYQSRHWASAPGKIVWSFIQFSGRNGGNIIFRTNYRYSVNGLDYVNDEVGFTFRDTFAEPLESAQAKLARYPANATVTVFYDPSAPERSCLQTGGDLTGHLLVIGGGLLMIVFGFYELRRLRRSVEKKN